MFYRLSYRGMNHGCEILFYLTKNPSPIARCRMMEGTLLFAILFPAVFPGGGDCMDDMTWTEFILVMTFLIQFAVFILSFFDDEGD